VGNGEPGTLACRPLEPVGLAVLGVAVAEGLTAGGLTVVAGVAA
jgi:hypothetical protein